MKITLCGSTKFKDQFEDWNARLSKQGHIVYSVSSYGHSDAALAPADKEMLDLVHLRKIIESDAILVVGWDGKLGRLYVGDSTRREIKWAHMWDKVVYGLTPFMKDGYAEHDVDLLLASAG